MTNYITGKKVFNTTQDAKNVAEYVVNRLVDLGITDVFALPGDFAFTIDEALIVNSKLRYIGSTNELNASYAADGYARVKGAALLSTTYAVGELSAINGVMGAKAENNIIFHLVGKPNQNAIENKQQLHHTLGDGDFEYFHPLSEKSACTSAIITPENAIREMNRVIFEAFYHRQPAYITVGVDIGHMPVTDKTEETYFEFISNQNNLNLATELIKNALQSAKTVIAIPSLKLDRYNLTNEALKLVQHLGIEYTVMPHDKSVMNELGSNSIGTFMGALSTPNVADKIKNADLILDLGGILWSDLNTGGFTASVDLSKVLSITAHSVKYQQHYLQSISFSDVVDSLLNQFPATDKQLSNNLQVTPIVGESLEKITLNSLNTRIAHMLEKDDHLITETGSSSVNFTKITIPNDVKYHNQTLWGSIGWATPATLGCNLAQQSGRTVLVTGEGSHLLTLNELATMGHYNANPIIFCINNNGYLVERALEVNPNNIYNDLPKVKYHQLPKAFGCDNWQTFVVTTNQELDLAIAKAKQSPTGSYIEVIAGKYDYGTVLNIVSNKIKNITH